MIRQKATRSYNDTKILKHREIKQYLQSKQMNNSKKNKYQLEPIFRDKNNSMRLLLPNINQE